MYIEFAFSNTENILFEKIVIAAILKSKPESDGQMQYTKDSLEGHPAPYRI